MFIFDGNNLIENGLSVEKEDVMELLSKLEGVMKYHSVLLYCLLTTFLMACGTNGKKRNSVLPDKPVVIVFENDVHCAVHGYAKLAGLRKMQKESTPYVTTVSCGDFLQGNIIASVSDGRNVVDIMNKVEYDVVILGNHEFDYGIPRMYNLMDTLQASVVCANFRDLRTSKRPFPAYHIIRYGDVDIAYLGFTTSITSTSVSPITFQDVDGSVIYDFMQQSFFQNAQKQIDAARSEGADYVVALAHLGDRDKEGHASSIDLINRTVGIDAVLDGHDHHLLTDTFVYNREGMPVLLASAGSKFSHIGLLTLDAKGLFHSQLVPVESADIPVDIEVQTYVETIMEKALADGRRVVGFNNHHLSIYDVSGKRAVRNREVPIGNFCADAFRLVLDTDVALLNSGGICSDIPRGKITYNHLYSVFPFNNTACVAMLTGRQLLDVLEVAVASLPHEDGTFMQVSGLKFKVNSLLPSSVLFDEDGLFLRVADGNRRVSDLQILDKKTSKYCPVELDKAYSVASFSYLLKELGCSGIFRYAELKADDLGKDVSILASYIEKLLGGHIPDAYAVVEKRIEM